MRASSRCDSGGNSSAWVLWRHRCSYRGSEDARRKIIRRYVGTVKEQQEFIVSSFPNLGVHTSKLLLEHYGTIKNLVNTSEEKLKELKGIGEKTAKNLVNIFVEKYKKE